MRASTEGTKMKCPACGKKIRTSRSMLGGTLAEWHTPSKRSKAPTFLKGYCIYSGTVESRR